jgi:M6 family metalloprotease-like protein
MIRFGAMNFRAQFAILVALLWLAGCQPAPAPTVTPTLTATATHTPLPTATLTPTATPPPAEQCQLPDTAYHGRIGLGYEGYAASLASTGTVRVKVIFVDFPDAPASMTPEEVYEIYLDGASEFFDVVSYGRLNFEMDAHFEWFRMSQHSSTYGVAGFDEHRAMIAEAIGLADGAVDFAPYDDVIVIANPTASEIEYGPTFVPSSEEYGIAVDGIVLMNAISSGYDLPVWGYKWVIHESGHSMGLVDLYSAEWTEAENYLELFKFTGDFSVMGNVAGVSPEFLAYERWLMRWLDDDQIYCLQSGSARVGLSPIEVPGGIKAVMVPTGATTAVIVESRRALGYDEFMAEEGALVYTLDTSVYTGYGPIVVPSEDETDLLRYYAPLAAGESMTVGAVTITVLDGGEDGDLVQVSVAQE